MGLLNTFLFVSLGLGLLFNRSVYVLLVGHFQVAEL